MVKEAERGKPHVLLEENFSTRKPERKRGRQGRGYRRREEAKVVL
jgi:hypothetical protein